MSQPEQTLDADAILDFLFHQRTRLREMGVVKIGLFGSFARGEQRPDSDIDLLVEMHTPSFRGYMHLLHFLEDHFGRRIDLGEVHLLKPLIRQQVLNEVRSLTSGDE